MPDLGPQWRFLTVEALQLLSSEPEQTEYEQAVPNVDITSELISIWFDQTYHPEDQQYRGAFSDAELDSLRAFHEIFDGAVDQLPQSQGTIKNWLNTSTWTEVMKKAESTLAHISRD